MWGMDFVLIKLGYSQFSIASSDTGSILMFAGTRFILSGIMTLAVLSAVKRKLMLLRKSNVVNACMLALFQTVGQYVLLYLGMARTSAVHASIFDSTLVFFSILISGFVFHQEKLSVNKIFGCVLGFFGIVVMNIGGSPEKSALLGDVLVLLCAAFTGLSHSLIKKFSQDDDPVFLSGWQLLLGGAYRRRRAYGRLTPAFGTGSHSYTDRARTDIFSHRSAVERTSEAQSGVFRQHLFLCKPRIRRDLFSPDTR